MPLALSRERRGVVGRWASVSGINALISGSQASRLAPVRRVTENWMVYSDNRRPIPTRKWKESAANPNKRTQVQWRESCERAGLGGVRNVGAALQEDAGSADDGALCCGPWRRGRCRSRLFGQRRWFGTRRQQQQRWRLGYNDRWSRDHRRQAHSSWGRSDQQRDVRARQQRRQPHSTRRRQPWHSECEQQRVYRF